MNGRTIPGAYLFRLYVCDKEMSRPHHTGETHQPDWVFYVRLCALVEDKCLNHFKKHSEKKRSPINFGQIFDFSFSKETEASY
jgi:hypothetical protein